MNGWMKESMDKRCSESKRIERWIEAWGINSIRIKSWIEAWGINSIRIESWIEAWGINSIRIESWIEALGTHSIRTQRVTPFRLSLCSPSSAHRWPSAARAFAGAPDTPPSFFWATRCAHLR